MGSDLFLKIECPECRRKICHFAKDVVVKTSRICPSCGKNILLAECIEGKIARVQLDC